MAGLTGHLVRRGFAVARDQYQSAASGNGEMKLSKEAVAVLSVTILLFTLWMFAIRYTYLLVVGTLAIVESPQTELLVQVDLADDGDDTKKLLQPDVMVVKPKPITNKLCTSIMHLRARAGYWSRFRGLSLYIAYSFARNILVHFLTITLLTRRPAGRVFAHFIAEVILCRFEMTWVHIVISEPSKLAWYRRLPRGLKPWKNIAPAAALKSAASQLVIALPAIYACHSSLAFFHARPSVPLSHADAKAALLDAFVVLGMYATLALLIEIPATVTFVRVAASMLPEEDEAIVPFDRSFGGRVVPAIVGGSGKIGLLDAWRSFNKSSRVRLLKVVFKVIAIQFAVVLLFIGVVIGELKLTMGDEFEKMVQQGQALVKM